MTPEQWAQERAKLEREIIECKQTISSYDGTFKPYRNVTDSEYRVARKRITEAATEISQGDYEINKPADPYMGMTYDELKTKYDEMTADYQARDGRDTRAMVEIMKVNTRMQAMENEKGADE
ncbi:hypothetical protein JOD43_003906 [Pullulanibacillus pueri]|uniref:Uncharacterized protein n=1 Tax=Pullulanibacillus pueri TaxID=1437324 RepID=A0A8J2ZYS9_9BACL|nr:hypothetical protein [Pullulanibacillus pueri]MBM7683726.1 hypothetical protein [Pullulanibacillus pueri]GGH85150.1 hypothetical protein GCM10007096_29870 [Pullulanibacillus pueri]